MGIAILLFLRVFFAFMLSSEYPPNWASIPELGAPPLFTPLMFIWELEGIALVVIAERASKSPRPAN